MTFPPVSPNFNQLLNSLPADEYSKLCSDLEPVKMKRGDVVYKAGERIKYVYFPENCILSMITIFEDGTSVESGIVGREGMTGAGIILADTMNARETFVQTSGQGWRMNSENFSRAIAQSDTLKTITSNYASAFFDQVAQAGACSNHHSLIKRLARLLLMCHDRVEGDNINITHEIIAQMLGAYRPNVTNAAMILKDENKINYQRGLITILDRTGLENVACECYEAINESYRHYLSSLETSSQDGRTKRANHAITAEITQRRKQVQENQIRLQNLQTAADRVKTLRGEYSLCHDCHFISDENGHRQQIDFFVEKRLNISINKHLCSICNEN